MSLVSDLYTEPKVLARELRITAPYFWNFVSSLKLDIPVVGGKRKVYAADEPRLREYVKLKISQGKGGPRLVYPEDQEVV